MCVTAAPNLQRKYSNHYECTAAETSNWHFIVAFSYRKDAVLMFFFSVLQRMPVEISVQELKLGFKKKKKSIPQENIVHTEMGEKII